MISIMNAGRGAGKTYQLIEWAKKANNRYIIGTHQATRDNLVDAGLGHRYIPEVKAKEFFEGRHDVQVAFDDFHVLLPWLLHTTFGVNTSHNDTILSMTLPDAELLPSMGLFSPLMGDYGENLLKRYNTEETSTE